MIRLAANRHRPKLRFAEEQHVVGEKGVARRKIRERRVILISSPWKIPE